MIDKNGDSYVDKNEMILFVSELMMDQADVHFAIKHNSKFKKKEGTMDSAMIQKRQEKIDRAKTFKFS